MKQKIERLRSLMEKATPGPYVVYSEPEVGLPPSLFAGIVGHTGFGPLEPLQGIDLHLFAEAVTALPDLLSHIDALEARVGDKGSDWFNGDVDCDGNELVTLPKDELDKYKDQVRYTCQRAEAAERALAEAVEVLRPFADGDLDISHTAIIPNYGVDVPGILERARACREIGSALGRNEHLPADGGENV